MMSSRNDRSALSRWRKMKDESGIAGVEFALIAPVFLLLLAAIFEIGLMLRTQSGLISAVSAVASQSLVIGEGLNDETAPGMAGTLAALLAGGGRAGTVNVNNAVTARLDEDVIVIEDNDAGSENCYCATRGTGGLTWGSSVQCDAVCADGSVAGRFVEITAQASFTPILGTIALFRADILNNTAVVRLP